MIKLVKDDIILVKNSRVGYTHEYFDLLIRKMLSPQLAEQLKVDIIRGLQLVELADKIRYRNIKLSDVEQALELKQRILDRIKELQEFPKSQYSSINQVKHAYSVESELQKILGDDKND